MWVLIGFQYVGKSTLAARWAQYKLQRRWVDTDRLIEHTYAHRNFVDDKLDVFTTRNIYQQHGEKYFRDLEQEIITSLQIDGSLIATGGGSVLRFENVLSLRKHGPLIFLNAPAELLYKRALSMHDTRYDSFEQYYIHYQERERVYKQYADHCLDVTNNDAIEQFISQERI